MIHYDWKIAAILIGFLLPCAGCEALKVNARGTHTIRKPAVAATPTRVPLVSGSERFVAARTVLLNRCVVCHEQHDRFAAYSEVDFIQTGLINQGSSATSTLYTILRGVSQNGSMPSGAYPPLSADELTTIRSWIDGIDNGGITPPKTVRRRAAIAVLAASCASCHGVTRTSATYGIEVPAFTRFTTDEQFTAASLVVQGNAADSWLYDSLADYGTIESMPAGTGPSGEITPISAADAQKIREWIEGI